MHHHLSWLAVLALMSCSQSTRFDDAGQGRDADLATLDEEDADLRSEVAVDADHLSEADLDPVLDGDTDSFESFCQNGDGTGRLEADGLEPCAPIRSVLWETSDDSTWPLILITASTEEMCCDLRAHRRDLAAAAHDVFRHALALSERDDARGCCLAYRDYYQTLAELYPDAEGTCFLTLSADSLPAEGEVPIDDDFRGELVYLAGGYANVLAAIPNCGELDSLDTWFDIYEPRIRDARDAMTETFPFESGTVLIHDGVGEVSLSTDDVIIGRPPQREISLSFELTARRCP